MIDCPTCGFPLELGKIEHCPKCGERVRGAVLQGLLEVDVAHSGERWEEALEKVRQAVNQALLNGHSGVKIIHGWGSSTGRSVISGPAVSMLRGFAQRYGGRLTPDKHNPGAHVLWLNR